MDINAIKELRFRFLSLVYDLSGGNQHKVFMMQEVGKQLGMERELITTTHQYLVGEGLLNTVALGGAISITHEGVREIEEAMSSPDEPTEHFLPINVITIQNMTNSSIQQASPGSTQTVTVSHDNVNGITDLLQEVESVLADLGLDEQSRGDLSAESSTIRSQLGASQPKTPIVQSCLTSIGQILGRATNAALSSALTAKVAALLAAL